MAYLTIYPTPYDANCILTHDSGWSVNGVISHDPNGRSCQTFNIPDSTTDMWGCRLLVEFVDKVPFNNRGLLMRAEDTWYFYLDDITLADPIVIEVPAPPTTPTTPPEASTPAGLISAIYNTGMYDLTTKEGCGEFTEECCTQLHDQFSQSWGHIRKTSAQNNYNGHAVDAVQLLVREGETKPGIYDIIYSTESDDAKPQFNYAGEARPDLWYYPA